MSSIPRLCGFEGCEESCHARGLCKRHYQLARRRGQISNIRERHGMTDTPEHWAWENIRGRCLNSNNPGFRNYGARGITICERYYKSFTEFYKDLGPRPESTSLDRENNDGGYWCGKCEECLANGWTANCRWATLTQQTLNQRQDGRNRSGYRGVGWDKQNKKWRALIGGCNSGTLNLGRFDDPTEAANMYDQYAIQIWGDDARPNFEYLPVPTQPVQS